MRRLARLAACAVLGAALAACATERVVLLPAEAAGGPAGAVVVLDPATGAERGQLTTANTQTRLNAGAVRPAATNANFDALLSAMPPPVQVFTLYFNEGTTDLTPQSAPTLEQLRSAVVAAPAADVQITGYTDTTGDPDSNDRLSLDRAVGVRAALVQDGLPVASARVTGRGQRDLKVPTGPGVSEPANRRVEVIVR
jgi:outer membrane protein OmpA-like peptidoglycan-associated protein